MRVKVRLAAVAHGTVSNSAKYEYATGTTRSVSSRHSVCPPIIVTAIDARCSEPAPIPMATGIRPATIESVVIKIGRRRTRFRLKDGFAHGHATGAKSICVVNLQDSIFLYDSQQQKHSEGAPETSERGL